MNYIDIKKENDVLTHAIFFSLEDIDSVKLKESADKTFTIEKRSTNHTVILKSIDKFHSKKIDIDYSFKLKELFNNTLLIEHTYEDNYALSYFYRNYLSDRKVVSLFNHFLIENNVKSIHLLGLLNYLSDIRYVKNKIFTFAFLVFVEEEPKLLYFKLENNIIQLCMFKGDNPWLDDYFWTNFKMFNKIKVF